MIGFTEIGYDTVKSYHKGEDWVAELAEDLGSFSVAALAGSAIITMLGTSIIPILIAAGATVYLSEKLKDELSIFFRRYQK